MKFNLRHLGAKRLWDWAFLNPCFKRGIQVMDIDGFVEVKGRFLVLESKPIGGALSGGQAEALNKLAFTKGFVVVIIEGTPPSEVFSWYSMRKPAVRGTSYESLMEFVEAWFEWADDEMGEST
jgi:hypothetical protein